MEPVHFWLLIIGIIQGIFMLTIPAAVGAYVRISERMARVETTLALIGVKSAKALHSPHTPELDSLLEKYCDRHYELSFDEWTRMLKMCEDIENDKGEPGERKALAGFIVAIASHKLMLPEFKPKKHE